MHMGTRGQGATHRRTQGPLSNHNVSLLLSPSLPRIQLTCSTKWSPRAASIQHELRLKFNNSLFSINAHPTPTKHRLSPVGMQRVS